MKQEIKRLIAILALTTLISACQLPARQQYLSDSTLPESQHSQFDTLKYDDSANIDQYKKIIILPPSVSYAERTAKSHFQRDEDFQLKPSHLEKFQRTFTEAFAEKFEKELGLTVTYTPGPDVMVMKTRIAELALNAPLDDVPVNSRSFTQESSTMIIATELLDVNSEKVFFQAQDKITTGTSHAPHRFERHNSVRYWFEARLGFSRLAQRITKAL